LADMALFDQLELAKRTPPEQMTPAAEVVRALVDRPNRLSTFLRDLADAGRVA
jgi:hypothetical protein